MDPNQGDLSQTVAVTTVGSDASLDMDQGRYREDLLDTPNNLSDADALRYEHPDYRKMVDKWNKYIDTYEGEDIWQFIHQHIRESEQMFQNRVMRGYYYNYVASCIDLYIAYIYHSPITRQIDEALFKELYDDADIQGTKFEVFIQQAAISGQLCGHCGILVDMPKAPDGGYETEEERKVANHRPYLTLFNATQIKDWEVDKFGKFDWVKLEVFRPQQRQWNQPLDEEVRNFLIWTRTTWEEWKLIGDNALKVDGGSHDLGVVPLVILRNERKPRHIWMGVSAVRDITDINIGIINWCSLGDEEIFERCLNVLTMERDEGDTPAELSHHNVLEYAPGAEPPRYLVPGASPLELIGKWIERAKDEIYRLAKFGGSVGLMGVRQATSGIAYAFEFNETNQSLAKKATNVGHAEIEVHRLYAKWLGKEFTGTIIYPQEFGVEDFLLELQILTEGRATLTSETAVRELEKKVLTKMFARDAGKLRDTIAKEVDEADPGLTVAVATVPKIPEPFSYQSKNELRPPGRSGQKPGRRGVTNGQDGQPAATSAQS